MINNILKAFILSSFLGTLLVQNVWADTNITAHLANEGPAMKISVDKVAVPAGKVTFKAVNDSKYMDHEMIVVKVKNFHDALPYKDAKNRIDEDKLDAIGEIEDLTPQTSKEKSFDLKPGKYLIFCNIADHFESGMFTHLIVY